jgi:DNA mismatch endonuclease (patch repair protein)
MSMRSKVTMTRRPEASSPSVRFRMQRTKQRDTPAELQLRSALFRLGLRYRIDASLPGSRRRADVVFRKAKVAVFIDGCFWHGCPLHGTWPKSNAAWWRSKIQANKERDADTNDLLRRAGWTVLRFWSHEDMKGAANSVYHAIHPHSKKLRRAV